MSMLLNKYGRKALKDLTPEARIVELGNMVAEELIVNNMQAGNDIIPISISINVFETNPGELKVYVALADKVVEGDSTYILQDYVAEQVKIREDQSRG